ncbi:MAG: hypothetical protein FWG65_11260, partial [Turicibacter sp.]|nr:hypothetical protein [Turicibacter sp.]
MWYNIFVGNFWRFLVVFGGFNHTKIPFDGKGSQYGVRRWLLSCRIRKKFAKKSRKGLTNLPDCVIISRAEQSRAEQSRAEQSRAEQSRAEQSRA